MSAFSPLFTRSADGNYVPASYEEVLAIAKKAISSRNFTRGMCMSNISLVADFCQLQIADRKNEVFAVLFLDTRHRLIKFVEMFQGGLDGCSVPAREIMRKALELNAAAVIVTHNHPSGMADPSASDIAFTKRLTEALEYIDVRVLDHIIVGDGYTSFAARGLI